VGPDERAGVEHFIARTRSEQEEGNQRLEAALGEIERSALRARIARLATLASQPVGGGAGEAQGEQEATERRRAEAHAGRGREDVPPPAGTRGDAAARPQQPSSPAQQDGTERELLADRVYGLDGGRP
jgi:hypothetical protein